MDKLSSIQRLGQKSQVAVDKIDKCSKVDLEENWLKQVGLNHKSIMKPSVNFLHILIAELENKPLAEQDKGCFLKNLVATGLDISLNSFSSAKRFKE